MKFSETINIKILITLPKVQLVAVDYILKFDFLNLIFSEYSGIYLQSDVRIEWVVHMYCVL